MHRRFTRRSVAAAAGLGVLSLAGCAGKIGSTSRRTSSPGATTGPKASPVPNESAEAILRAASARLAATQSLRFKLKIDGDTFIDDKEQIQLLEASGDLVRPDKVRTSFKVKVLNNVTASISLITIGGKHWSTDLINGKWNPAPAEFSYDPSILFDNQGGIGPVMDKVHDAARLPDDKIDGKHAYHLQAQVDQAVIADLTSQTMKGSPITVDLWIDKANNDLLRAQLAEPANNGKAHPATWTLDLYDHGKPITIEPPV